MAKRELKIETPDGTADAGLFTVDGAASKGAVIVYMDAFGLRPALDQIAERIAGLGYVVLVPDTLYRFAPYGPYDARTAFSDEATKAEIIGMIRGTTQAMTIADTGAFLEALAEAGHNGPVATVGYCMGGARAINAAAHYPDRIVAAASFHGGGLASDADDSPHRKADRIRGRIYVGCAGVDGSFPPEQSARLARAFREAEVDHTIENYVGMAHGWCVPDHGVFDAAGAERHWKRLEMLLTETLAG